jgi:hypothetical protein
VQKNGLTHINLKPTLCASQQNIVRCKNKKIPAPATGQNVPTRRKTMIPSRKGRVEHKDDEDGKSLR